MTITRRQLLKVGLYGGPVLLLGKSGCGAGYGVGGSWDELASYDVPLPIPSVLQPTTRTETADHYHLVMKEGTTQLRPGPATRIWGYNGIWPGPTIEATRGRTVFVTQSNELSENMTIHNHGHFVAAEHDGHPTRYIRPGASHTYEYPNEMLASTFWYHDHAMDITGPHVYKGLAAFYLIKDPSEALLLLPSGAYDVPLLFQDRTLDADNQLVYTLDEDTLQRGFHGTSMCVNGAINPYFKVAARKYRFRLLNGCNARNVGLALSDGTMTQISSDGGLLAAPVVRSRIDLGPAERADVVIDFSRYPLGKSVYLRNVDPSLPSLPNVMRFDVDRIEPDTSRVPATLAAVPRMDPASATVHRKFRLHQDKVGKRFEWRINGLGYDESQIHIYPKLNTTEIWTVFNDSAEMHPFHQHLLQFQILDVDGATPPAWQQGWKDVIAIQSGQTVNLIMRFERFTGVYVYHCHKLEHEDHRMMLQQEVVG